MRNINTLFIGKVVHRFSHLPSTNLYALELLAKDRPAEGTVVLTDHQTDGRGQIGSRWISDAGKNLTFSVILSPRFLPARDQFLLNQAVALSVLDGLPPLLSCSPGIKWPNDIYIGNRKVGGILIQNSLSGDRIQHSVVGIGLNVNQTGFYPGLPNPTSLKNATAGREFDREDLLDAILSAMESRYLQLRSGDHQGIRHDYLKNLYRLGAWHLFRRPGGIPFQGCITGIGPTGKLALQTNEGVQLFDLKEIEFCISPEEHDG